MNDGCSATSKSNHIKKDEKMQKFLSTIDFSAQVYRLSRLPRTTIDFRLSKILSTFDFPRARVEAWSAKNPEVLTASGFFFDIVGRQMSSFAIFRGLLRFGRRKNPGGALMSLTVTFWALYGRATAFFRRFSGICTPGRKARERGRKTRNT